jgi:hypothetical protein
MGRKSKRRVKKYRSSSEDDLSSSDSSIAEDVILESDEELSPESPTPLIEQEETPKLEKGGKGKEFKVIEKRLLNEYEKLYTCSLEDVKRGQQILSGEDDSRFIRTRRQKMKEFLTRTGQKDETSPTSKYAQQMIARSTAILEQNKRDLSEVSRPHQRADVQSENSIR